MPSKRDPILTTFFLADRLLHDGIRNQWSAIGIANVWRTEEFPMCLPELWFFARVADAPRKINMRASVVNSEGMVIATQERPFELQDTPQAHSGGLDGWWEVGGVIRQVIFTRPGVYQAEFAINGEVLGSTTIHAFMIDK